MTTTSPNLQTSEKGYKALQIDFLDKLLDLDILDDKDGYHRNTQYLFGRKARQLKRKQYRELVVNPLIERGYVSEFKDYRYINWGVSFEITEEGRDYLKRQEIIPSKEQYLKDARAILRLIFSNVNSIFTFEDIVREFKGRSRILNETLRDLLMMDILDIDHGGYKLTGKAYLTYVEIREASKREPISDEVKDKLEDLLGSIDDEDYEDDD
jgi:hypothetical protein